MPFIASIDIISLQPPPDPRRGFIIVANHRSLLDLIVGLIVFRRWRISPYIFVREDIFQIPIVGWLLGAVGGIPTGPENGVAAMRKGLHVLQQGGTLMIMPEGGIPKIYGPEDQFGRLKPGVARLASTSGNPVLIVGLANTDHAWPPGTVTPRFHLRRSRRPNIIMSAEWLPVTKGTSNSQILAAIDDGLRSILRRLDPP
jgi:1-acyl-sn-glycerol-3-phosphate acyltransferase